MRRRYDVPCRVDLYVNGNNAIYFDSFGVEHIPKEIKKFIRKRKYHKNTNRIQAYDSTCVDVFVLDLLILC